MEIAVRDFVYLHIQNTKSIIKKGKFYIQWPKSEFKVKIHWIFNQDLQFRNERLGSQCKKLIYEARKQYFGAL